MKILVCVKVCDGALTPFDEAALECALRLSDDVTTITMGPPSNKEVLLPLTRLGAKPVLISDKLYAGSDTLATAYILSEFIKKSDYDLILCGRQSIDGDTAQVGPMLSQKLGIPLVTNAMQVESDNGGLDITTRDGMEKTTLPALVTLERSYILRFPSIFSRLGEVAVFDNSFVNCDPEKCGLTGSPTRVLETFENERGRRSCKFIKPGELEDLIMRLMNENDTPQKQLCEKAKLTRAWAIGGTVAEKAREIAKDVEIITESSPEKIAELAKNKKPNVILWNADLWGRKNAPIVAAMLETGLCADCTDLEAEGETLIMYRPARSGNIIAKIKCQTLPQMATVRTKTKGSDIVVSGGKGVADKVDKLKRFAENIGAELGASRGLVDMGKMPYIRQVGLTGKAVAPKIYIAVGISGAVHHTCAIEGSKTIIAINPDKNARIFDYADYGIIDDF